MSSKLMCVCPSKLLDDIYAVHWAEADFGAGPDKTGWTMFSDRDSFVNLKCCPECGNDLSSRPKPETPHGG